MKFFLWLIGVLFFSFFSFLNSANSSCQYNENWSIKWNLDNCLSDSTLVWWDAKVWGWFDETIKKWVKNISIFLWIWAVFGIVYGSFMMTISSWEDEKVNKAKDTIKWSIIWFIWLITASFLINLIIRLFYSI